MGHEPALVGAVAGKTAVEVIVDAAAAHGAQGLQHMCPLRRASRLQEKLQDRPLREFRSGIHAAERRIIKSAYGLCSPVWKFRMDVIALSFRLHVVAGIQRGGQGFGIGEQRLSVFLPEPGDFGKNLSEGRTAIHGTRGKIGSSPERMAVRSEKHGQWPAPLLSHHSQSLHVVPIDVRPFLAIHLDVDEMGVHESGCFGIIEAFIRHDMAPVAGGIAHGKENGPVLPAGGVQRFLAPWPPVHGVVRVLAQIGAGFSG